MKRFFKKLITASTIIMLFLFCSGFGVLRPLPDGTPSVLHDSYDSISSKYHPKGMIMETDDKIYDIRFTYDSKGHLINLQYLTTDKINDTIVYDAIDYITYDSKNNRTEINVDVLDFETNTRNIIYSDKYDFDNSGNLLSVEGIDYKIIFDLNYDGSVLNSYSCTTTYSDGEVYKTSVDLTYTDKNKVKTATFTSLTTNQTFRSYEYSYNEHNDLIKLVDIYEGNKSEYNYTLSYDDEGNLVKLIYDTGDYFSIYY